MLRKAERRSQRNLRSRGGIPNLRRRFDTSTDHVPESERFDFFREVIANRYCGFDAATNWSDNFTGRMTGFTVGDVTIAHSVTSPALWIRTLCSRLHGEEWVALTLIHRGNSKYISNGEELALSTGAVALLPGIGPCEKHNFEISHMTSIKIPRKELEKSLSAGYLARPAILPSDNIFVRLLTNYLKAYARNYQKMPESVASLAGRHIIDVVALAIGANGESPVETQSDSLKEARIESILAAIAANHRSPGLSPDEIGASLGISARQLYRLLEETNRTFYEHLLEARLSTACRMLQDPRLERRTIGDIANKAGFTNLSYFSRVFRRRFGDSPSSFRAVSP